MSYPSMTKYLTTAQAAQYLAVSRDVLRRWRAARHGGPRYYRINKMIRYSLGDLDSFLVKCSVGGDSDA